MRRKTSHIAIQTSYPKIVITIGKNTEDIITLEISFTHRIGKATAAITIHLINTIAIRSNQNSTIGCLAYRERYLTIQSMMPQIILAIINTYSLVCCIPYFPITTLKHIIHTIIHERLTVEISMSDIFQ